MQYRRKLTNKTIVLIFFQIKIELYFYSKQQNKRMQTEFDIKEDSVFKLFEAYKNYCVVRENIYGENTARLPNFPEDVSENIVKFLLRKIMNRDCNKAKVGDLVSDGKKIEVKCFVSNGPSSFGPTEEFDELYFVDARKFKESFFEIYKVDLTSQSEAWNNIQVSKASTMLQQKNQKRRPRISFMEIRKQIPEFINLVYKGTLDELLF